MLLHNYLLHSASRFPNKTAVYHKGKTASYEEIYDRSLSIANWLKNNGMNKGDRVAILLDRPFEYIESYFGILMAGGVVVALNIQTSVRTLEYQLNNCEVFAIIAQAKFQKYLSGINGLVPSIQCAAIVGWTEGLIENPKFRCFNYDEVSEKWSVDYLDAHNIVSSDYAQLIYTSGTTGEASAVVLRHSNLVSNTSSIIEYLKLTENDKVMAVLPFFYSYGNSVLLTHIVAGGTLVVRQEFLYPNEIIEDMLKEEVTGFSGVPSTYAILLNRSAIRHHQFPSLRYITQAGGAMSPKLAIELKTILPNVDIYIMYGQTEASARLSYLEPEELLRKAGSIGKAIPGVTLEVLNTDGCPVKPGEVGEIVARGDNIMPGYWRDPEKTAKVLRKEGLWTGDLAKIDEEGFIYIVSRKSDIIKSGAHRISPKEIEEIILEHVAVHEVAVVGIEDEILGEAIKACVVLKEGSSCTKRELLAHCHKLLPLFKVPQHITFHKELPKTSSGKIRKSELKQIVLVEENEK